MILRPPFHNDRGGEHDAIAFGETNHAAGKSTAGENKIMAKKSKAKKSAPKKPVAKKKKKQSAVDCLS